MKSRISTKVLGQSEPLWPPCGGEPASEGGGPSQVPPLLGTRWPRGHAGLRARPPAHTHDPHGAIVLLQTHCRLSRPPPGAAGLGTSMLRDGRGQPAEKALDARPSGAAASTCHSRAARCPGMGRRPLQGPRDATWGCREGEELSPDWPPGPVSSPGRQDPISQRWGHRDWGLLSSFRVS